MIDKNIIYCINKSRDELVWARLWLIYCDLDRSIKSVSSAIFWLIRLEVYLEISQERNQSYVRKISHTKQKGL